MAEPRKITVKIGADASRFAEAMRESQSMLDDFATAAIQRRAEIDEARALVLIRWSLPRGFKWLVGFPRLLRRIYALRLLKRPDLGLVDAERPREARN